MTASRNAANAGTSRGSGNSRSDGENVGETPCLTALEQVLTSFYKRDMIAFMHAHPEAYDEAITLAVGDRQPLSWRAAWLLIDCIDDDDPRVRPHIRRIIAAIPGKADGHQRELIKLLSRMTFSERDEGRVFDLCLSLWETLGTQPSVRVNALKLLVQIAHRHPELSREITLLVQDRHLETLSAPVRKSVSKILKGLEPKRGSRK
jgi:hypothetical protein